MTLLPSVSPMIGPRQPLPDSLRGSEIGSFAHRTVTQRMPELGRLAIKENRFPPEVNARLEDLLAEIPWAILRPLHDPGAPDVADWDRYLAAVEGQNWLQVPWFFAETYFYRRILEATGYFQSGSTQGIDPYTSQKYQVMAVSQPVIRAMSDRLNTMLQTQRSGPPGAARHRQDLIDLLGLNLWGNQADLSMWPAGHGERPDHRDPRDQQSHLLDDDRPALVDYLIGLSNQQVTGPGRIDFIIDNAGLELVNDLVLADYLLSAGLLEAIRFHLKVHPTYISDALIADVRRTIHMLAADDQDGVQDLAGRLNGHLASGRLQLEDHLFWTSPLSFWQMPAPLQAELSRSHLLVSKGDANYRRLLGDRRWPPTTPLGDVLNYVPAPLAALRVLKAEVVIGLRPEQVSCLEQEDPNWLFDGNWGVIQFIHTKRSQI
jgi:uncharacterized protein with ATP-grasp and redox domains